MRHNPLALQLLLDLHGGGGLSGAGGSGEQNDMGLSPVVGNLPGRRLHFFCEGCVTLCGVGGRVAADGIVQLFQGIGHSAVSFQTCS